LAGGSTGGTKEFLKGTGEFTVNIALVENGKPVIGVVHAPVLGLMYFADLDCGAFRQNHNQAPARLRVQRPVPEHLRVCPLLPELDHLEIKVRPAIEFSPPTS